VAIPLLGADRRAFLAETLPAQHPWQDLIKSAG
jgi:hypothetical protein